MADLPSHHDTGATGPGTSIERTSTLRKVLIASAVIVLLVLAVVLHMTGVLDGESH